MEVGVERGLTPLVGRQKELALLRDRLMEARTGRGQIVLLAGEPGVGKSRLLLEFQQSPGAVDISWLAGRSVSFGNQMAYLPIIDLLKGLFQIEEGDTPAAISARIEAEVKIFLTPVARPVDIHISGGKVYLCEFSRETTHVGDSLSLPGRILQLAPVR